MRRPFSKCSAVGEGGWGEAHLLCVQLGRVLHREGDGEVRPDNDALPLQLVAKVLELHVVLGFGFWVLGFGFRVLGFGFWVSGFGFRVLGFWG